MLRIISRFARALAVAGAMALGVAVQAAAAIAQSASSPGSGHTSAVATSPHVAMPRLLPRPSTMSVGEGTFTLADPVRIVVDSSNGRLAEIGGFLAQVLASRTGFRVVESQHADPGPAIVLALAESAPGGEGYALHVTADSVLIRSRSASGIFWGVQSLRQLLPPEFEALDGPRPAAWLIPVVSIRDTPRFAWRGSLMDVSRHFFPASFVKRYIDLLSRYKMNVLHWHLTDDQGWRIDIPAYPRLTEVGAWRTEPDGSRYGGYYTQAEIRDIVEFARRRNVTIVPEIEMPGHAQAAIAAYPHLGCTGATAAVASRWGVSRDVFCPGNEDTFTFLEGVLDDVMTLFPSPYIHIGGDEVPKDRWRACASCQALMRREGLANEDELQAWFIARIARYLAAHDRHLIGWDEILDGGLADGPTVQVWRDTAHVTTAVRLGHDVIASPASHAYLDASPRSLPLGRVWSFNPVPAGLSGVEARHVLGGEANLWAEYITPANFDAMAFPRILAMAEVLWSTPPRDSLDFLERVRGDHARRLAALQVRVGPEDQDIVRMRTRYDAEADVARVDVTRGMDDIVVRLTSDGSVPTPSSSRYVDADALPRAGTVRLRAFLGGQPLPRELHLELEAHAARGGPVTVRPTPSGSYPGTGRFTLTDGLHGTTNHQDGLWQGWAGSDVEATVDLGTVTGVDTIRASFLHATPSWILLPLDVEFAISADGDHWVEVGRVGHEEPAERDDSFRHAFVRSLPRGTRARFVRIRARNAGPLPAWHPGAGRPSWIFADELVVR
jgi:hexosaminidase